MFKVLFVSLALVGSKAELPAEGLKLEAANKLAQFLNELLPVASEDATFLGSTIVKAGVLSVDGHNLSVTCKSSQKNLRMGPVTTFGGCELKAIETVPEGSPLLTFSDLLLKSGAAE